MAEEYKKVTVIGNYGLNDDVIRLTGAEIRIGDYIKFIDDEGFHEVVLIYRTFEEDNTYKVTRDFFTQDSTVEYPGIAVSPRQRGMSLPDGKEGFIVANMMPSFNSKEQTHQRD